MSKVFLFCNLSKWVVLIPLIRCLFGFLGLCCSACGSLHLKPFILSNTVFNSQMDPFAIDSNIFIRLTSLISFKITPNLVLSCSTNFGLPFGYSIIQNSPVDSSTTICPSLKY